MSKSPELNASQCHAATGPIQITYPVVENGQNDPLISAWVESQGYGRNTDLLAEQKTVGTRDYTATIDPVTGLRSSADPEYGAIASAR